MREPHALPLLCSRLVAGRCLDGHFAGAPPAGVCLEACKPCEAVVRARDGVDLATNGEDLVEPPASDAVPRREWPAWANLVAKRAAPADRGVGDTVERELGTAGETFKSWWKETIGRVVRLGCGCDGRRDRWNARYPYSATAGTKSVSANATTSNTVREPPTAVG